MVLAWQARLRKLPSFINIKGQIKLENPVDTSTTAERLLGKSKAQGTLKSYDSVIRKLETFVEHNNLQINPVTKQVAADFVCYLADEKVPITEVCKIGPGLTLLHHSQGHSTPPAV